jgi:hypothetical protein
LIPTSPRHISPATSQITKLNTLRRTLESASMRCSARTLVSPVSSRAAGVRLRIAPMRSRTAPECSLVRERFTALRPTQFAMTAMTRIATILRGGPSSQSATSESFSSSSTVLRT